MRLGISSYCLDREIGRGDMTLPDVIEWAARMGAECMELVPFAFRFDDRDTGVIDTAAIKAIVRHARDAGIALVNYSVLADLCVTGREREAVLARLKREVDIACELGVPRMRHDVSAFRRPQGSNTSADFDQMLPLMADGAREITRYAASRGIRTMIENHGFFANGCDRVERVIRAVDDANYGLLLDTGNVACVDEDPAVAAVTLAPLCRMVHLKDFYIRLRDPGDSTAFDCAGSWFRSRGGKYLRGAILGQGDLDIYQILAALKQAGYNGDIAIEFEGMEDARYATSVSLLNARRIWEAV